MKTKKEKKEQEERVTQFKYAHAFLTSLLRETTAQPINIVFDGPPAPESGRFVEVETDDGHSVCVGKWIKRKDGFWALRITSLVPEKI